jgi:deoxyribonuclease-4
VLWQRIPTSVKRLIGAHMSTSKGFDGAIREGAEIGCDCVQVFTSSPMMWKGKTIKEEDVAKFHAAIKETKMGAVLTHGIYLMNLASPDATILERSKQAYVEELTRCAKLGIPHAVVHVGKHMSSGEEAGVKTLGESIAWVLDNSEGSDIAMETDAGQGTCIGHKFEHLGKVLEMNKGHKRLRVCMDTCHIFAAGYDIRTPAGFKKVLDEFDKIIGLDCLIGIHANDSKYPLGSQKDRHQHIGDGDIGLEAFRFLVNEKRIAHAPIYVETPEMETMHAENVRRLRSLVK